MQKRKPILPTHSVCLDCKRNGIVCVVVAQGIPCLGPSTRTGCGVLCPAKDRGCYGCFRTCLQHGYQDRRERAAARGALSG